MKTLLLLIRIYWWIIIITALSSWIPLPAAVSEVLFLLTWPVWKLFGWARIGAFHLGGIVAILLLWALENWVKKQVEEQDSTYHPSQPVEDEDQQ